ncbi:hypothetical protein ACROYT_G011387 [Oculina patagonica]
MDCVSAGNQCREERSVSGMALQGFVFKKFSVSALHECDISCEREITCQSYNYAAGEKSCELNNRTKEARPENLRSAPAWFYKRRLSDRAPLGSILELPAQSCQEIKASEGKDTISSKYWLDPTGTGTAVLVYCDMNLEAPVENNFLENLRELAVPTDGIDCKDALEEITRGETFSSPSHCHVTCLR